MRAWASTRTARRDPPARPAAPAGRAPRLPLEAQVRLPAGVRQEAGHPPGEFGGGPLLRRGLAEGLQGGQRPPVHALRPEGRHHLLGEAARLGGPPLPQEELGEVEPGQGRVVGHLPGVEAPPHLHQGGDPFLRPPQGSGRVPFEPQNPQQVDCVAQPLGEGAHPRHQGLGLGGAPEPRQAPGRVVEECKRLSRLRPGVHEGRHPPEHGQSFLRPFHLVPGIGNVQEDAGAADLAGASRLGPRQ
jgi:hypothetical protein